MKKLERITFDRAVMGGRPCIRGLRVTVGTLVGLLAAGKSREDILRLYPKKKSRREGRTIVFIDESGLSEKCPVTRTWALKGHTPIIQQSFTWKQMSAIAGLSWWRFYFRFVEGAINSRWIIEFLGALLKNIGKSLLILWDGVGAHKSRLVRNWVENQNGRIAIAFLPPYAPELNPVEAIWAYLKKHEIANLCPTNLAEVSDFARRRLKSMQRRPKLIAAFWQQAELSF